MVLQRFIWTMCFGLAAAIALGAASAAIAAPRQTLAIDASARPARIALLRRKNAALRGHARSSLIGVRRYATSRPRYRAGEHRVAQISSSILRRASFELTPDAASQCGRKRHYPAACSHRANLVDALLEAPTPATEQILRDLGIPVIKDVPAIAILRGGSPGADDISIDTP